MEEQLKKLTGVRDVDIKILNNLGDKTLNYICKSEEPYLQSLCDDENLWLNRIITKYGQQALVGYNPYAFSDEQTESKHKIRDYYFSDKLKSYVLCEEINKIKHSSQLVVDDFYNPYIGFINSNITRSPQILSYLILKIVLQRMVKFRERDLKEEQILKETIQEQFNQIPNYNRDFFIFEPTIEELSIYEKDMFMKLIDTEVDRAMLLRSSTKPIIKALSPRPEDKFRLIAYIHQGFRTGQIPLDILWDELCSLQFVLNYKFV